MKKLYTLILAAASASMMFAQMPIMQQQVSFSSDPVLRPVDKTEMINLYNQSKSLNRFNAQNYAARLNTNLMIPIAIQQIFTTPVIGRKFAI